MAGDPDISTSWRGVRLLLPVHDEVLLEVPAAGLGEVARGAAGIMRRAGAELGIGVGLPVRASAGASWGGLEPVEGSREDAPASRGSGAAMDQP